MDRLIRSVDAILAQKARSDTPSGESKSSIRAAGEHPDAAQLHKSQNTARYQGVGSGSDLFIDDGQAAIPIAMLAYRRRRLQPVVIQEGIEGDGARVARRHHARRLAIRRWRQARPLAQHPPGLRSGRHDRVPARPPPRITRFTLSPQQSRAGRAHWPLLFGAVAAFAAALRVAGRARVGGRCRSQVARLGGHAANACPGGRSDRRPGGCQRFRAGLRTGRGCNTDPGFLAHPGHRAAAAQLARDADLSAVRRGLTTLVLAVKRDQWLILSSKRPDLPSTSPISS